MGKDKRDVLILILILVIVVLIGFVAYAFLIQPALSGLVVQGQNEGVEYTILSIANQAVTCQPVSLAIGNETIELIWIECLQEAQKSEENS